jgi:hypothetical protein
MVSPLTNLIPMITTAIKPARYRKNTWYVYTISTSTGRSITPSTRLYMRIFWMYSLAVSMFLNMIPIIQIVKIFTSEKAI